MTVVVVTGAGASREIGLNSDLPLMSDWCDRLCEELEAQEPGLAAAAGLKAGLSSEDFEEVLGALLRWQELRSLNQRFARLGGKAVGKYASEIAHSFERETERLHTIMATLNSSLYREFGSNQVSADGAAKAYGWLLSLLEELCDGTPPIFVTTNYDWAIEMGLAELGYVANTGFLRRPGITPKLSPEGLIARIAESAKETAVIHLHGAVGWYQQQDEVIESYADQPYIDEMGVPSVLYPDPEKDPTRDAAVQSLWDEFDHALAGASHVLVVGHSLHDEALVQRLRGFSGSVGACVHSRNADFQPTSDQLRRIKSLLPTATVIPCHFGPEPSASAERLKAWSTGSVLIETG